MIERTRDDLCCIGTMDSPFSFLLLLLLLLLFLSGYNDEPTALEGVRMMISLASVPVFFFSLLGAVIEGRRETFTMVIFLSSVCIE